MRRRRFGRRRVKRSVSWIDGLTTYDAAGADNTRTVQLTGTGFSANQYGSTIGLVINTDLPEHGGEDCVLTRVVGRLGFIAGRRDSGAGLTAFGFQCRVAITQVSEVAGTVNIITDDLLNARGMGKDNILFMRDVIVPNTAIGATGGGYDTTFASGPFWLDVDVRARRKVLVDAPIVVWFQSVVPGATGTVPLDFQLLGGLRTLLMRPR